MHCLARANDESQRLPIWREAAALPGTPSKGIDMIAMAELSGAATRTIPDLSFGVSYIRVVEASQKRNGDTPRGIYLQAPPRRRRTADAAAGWQTAVFRGFKIQSDGTPDNGFVRTR